MALDKLVQGECGTKNSLVKLSNHFIHDKAHQDFLIPSSEGMYSS